MTDHSLLGHDNLSDELKALLLARNKVEIELAARMFIEWPKDSLVVVSTSHKGMHQEIHGKVVGCDTSQGQSIIIVENDRSGAKRRFDFLTTKFRIV